MKTVLRVLFGKRAATAKPKKQKKRLSSVLTDKLLGILFSALGHRMNDDLWKPDI